MKLSIKELAVFAMLGGLMYATKAAMEFLPNIHLIGVFTVALTVVYRQKALFPLYVFVFNAGLFGGFGVWWIPYLYVWTVLWGVTMLLPRRMPKTVAPFVYAAVCGLHGFAFGTLYAPVQALLFGLDFEAMLAWIVAGLPFDITHGISNTVCGLLICPMIALLRLAEKAVQKG